MIPRNILFSPLFFLALFSSCAKTDKQVREAVRNDPDIIFDVIRENPEKFAKIMESSQKELVRAETERRKKADQERMEKEFIEPRVAKVGPHRVVEGPVDAPVEIVQYSDFQCPHCKKGAQTISELKKKYGDRIKIVYKHLPLPFHSLATPAAQRFEAIALQSKEKAKKFYDEVFANQSNLAQGGEALLDTLAKNIGANISKMKRDLKSDAIQQTISDDIAEAKSFTIQGTPGFIVGGVTVRGTRDIKEFEKIIDRRLATKNSSATLSGR